jgi:hypothetical protein
LISLKQCVTIGTFCALRHRAGRTFGEEGGSSIA